MFYVEILGWGFAFLPKSFLRVSPRLRGDILPLLLVFLSAVTCGLLPIRLAVALLRRVSLVIFAFAFGFSGKQQLAVSAFADALETMPSWLAVNFGLDPIGIMAELRSHHSSHRASIGVGESGCADMHKASVVELASIFKTTIWRTLEVASLLMKIDDYFYVKDLPMVHKK